MGKEVKQYAHNPVRKYSKIGIFWVQLKFLCSLQENGLESGDLCGLSQKKEHFQTKSFVQFIFHPDQIRANTAGQATGCEREHIHNSAEKCMSQVQTLLFCSSCKLVNSYSTKIASCTCQWIKLLNNLIAKVLY